MRLCDKWSGEAHRPAFGRRGHALLLRVRGVGVLVAGALRGVRAEVVARILRLCDRINLGSQAQAEDLLVPSQFGAPIEAARPTTKPAVLPDFDARGAGWRAAGRPFWVTSGGSCDEICAAGPAPLERHIA